MDTAICSNIAISKLYHRTTLASRPKMDRAMFELKEMAQARWRGMPAGQLDTPIFKIF